MTMAEMAMKMLMTLVRIKQNNDKYTKKTLVRMMGHVGYL